MNEIWKDIVGYEGYYMVSDLGRVKSIIRKGVTYDRILKHSIMPKGYHSVRLYKDKCNTQFLVHRLLALAFIPNPENKPEVNHINTNIDDNYLSNLEWNTQGENVSHSFSHGKKTNEGINNPRCRLTEQDVLDIRILINQGISFRSIGKQFNVSGCHISYIKCGKSWSHL